MFGVNKVESVEESQTRDKSKQSEGLRLVSSGVDELD